MSNGLETLFFNQVVELLLFSASNLCTRVFGEYSACKLNYSYFLCRVVAFQVLSHLEEKGNKRVICSESNFFIMVYPFKLVVLITLCLPCKL